MNTESVLRVLNSTTKLLGVIIWPTVTIIFLLRFGSALGDFMANMAEFSLKGAGFEATGRRQKTEAAAALGAAATSRVDAMLRLKLQQAARVKRLR